MYERRERDRPRYEHQHRKHSPRRESNDRSEDRHRDRDRAAPRSADDELARKKAAWAAKKAALKAANNATSIAARTAGLFSAPGDDDEDEPTGLAPRAGQPSVSAADKFRQSQRESAARTQAALAAREEAADALDAFMDAEVMPTVTVEEEKARKREAEEKRALLEQLKAGKGVPAVAAADVDDEEPEEVPTLEIQVPKHKVKLIIGAGGERIKDIQRKTKTRIQVKREQAELEKGFGTGPQVKLPGKVAAIAAKLNKEVGADVAMATLLIYGDDERCAYAKRLLLEAVENKEQKQKQRQKEYDKKRDEKNRNRQIYYMRHARDYEVLGIPVGTRKSEIERVFKKLRLKWHPDKNPHRLEEATKRFHEISKAYESLMSTDEEEAIKTIAGKS